MTACRCPARVADCNLTDCQLPSAVSWRLAVRPSLGERLASVVLWLTRRWWA